MWDVSLTTSHRTYGDFGAFRISGFQIRDVKPVVLFLLLLFKRLQSPAPAKKGP